jgi:hypothetical protein
MMLVAGAEVERNERKQHVCARAHLLDMRLKIKKVRRNDPVPKSRPFKTKDSE